MWPILAQKERAQWPITNVHTGWAYGRETDIEQAHSCGSPKGLKQS